MTFVHCQPLDMLRYLQAGELTSLEIIDAHIARIETWDHQVNSVVHRFFDRARSQAKDADALRAKKKKKVPALLGTPMTHQGVFVDTGHACESWPGGLA